MVNYIKNNITIEDVMSKYGVKHYKTTCNCPFHKDKNPSLIFGKDKFLCFSCGKRRRCY